jgi:uncharacterized protein
LRVLVLSETGRCLVREDTSVARPNDLNWQKWMAIWGSLAINAYVALSFWVLRPLHARGWGQGLLGQIEGVASVAQFPGYLVIHKTGLRAALSPPHSVSTLAWIVLLAFNVPIWTVTLRLVLGVLFPPRKVSEPASDETRPEPQPQPATLPSRRRFLVGGARVAVAGFGGVTAYGMFVEPRWFQVSRRTFPLRGLPAELNGLRIVQLTDIHHGPCLSLGYVRSVVGATNALKPDLILLTGDYVHRSRAYTEPVVRELAELRAGVGVVGVLGNHDWWEGAQEMMRCFAKAGIPLVDNDRLFVTRDRALVRRADEGLCVAGIGDYREDPRLSFADALGGVPADVPRLLLSHNPDAAEDQTFLNSRLRVDLMLSGHTHGGQCWVPGLGTPITASEFGAKYASGLVRGPACPVFVSRGIGTTVLPIRFGVPPEVAVIELRSA